MRAYQNNRERSHTIVLEGSLLAEVLLEYCSGRNGRFHEEKLLKDLLTDLKGQADIGGNSSDMRSKRKQFPKTSQGLRGQLQRLDPNLREIGITIKFLGKTGSTKRKGASVTIDYDPDQTSQTSQYRRPLLNRETRTRASAVTIKSRQKTKRHGVAERHGTSRKRNDGIRR